ncbi:hypothetical protein, partial [Clostridium cochlearium]|uniref:hypothetical protein n=1 Tax=Clostridium cochlearium TaxID=1494 RepID=UPI001EE0F3D4
QLKTLLYNLVNISLIYSIALKLVILFLNKSFFPNLPMKIERTPPLNPPKSLSSYRSIAMYLCLKAYN